MPAAQGQGAPVGANAWSAPIGALYMMIGHGATPPAVNQQSPGARAAQSVRGPEAPDQQFRNPTNSGQRTLLGQ